MSNLDNILEHRRKLDQAHHRTAMVEGAVRQVMLQIKQEYGCRTIEQARKVHERLQTDLVHKKRMAEKKQTAFEKKWQEHL